MYKAVNQGSVTNKEGRTFRFSLDSIIDAPKGSLGHCKDLKWINPLPKKTKAKNKAEEEAKAKSEDKTQKDAE